MMMEIRSMVMVVQKNAKSNRGSLVMMELVKQYVGMVTMWSCSRNAMMEILMMVMGVQALVKSKRSGNAKLPT